MRLDNIILTLVCGTAVAVAVAICWRWSRLPVVAPRAEDPETAGDAALDAIRTLACAIAAGFTAGVLVVGFGGRLVMRVLAATSGEPAQGRTTDAGEQVGEITFSGSLGFLLFAGVLIPVVSALVFIAFRRLVRGPAWMVGLLFGVLLLATFGVDDPLDPDNIDFFILAPLWLAVTLVCATAFLFGITLASLVARLDATTVPIRGLRGSPPRDKAVYVSLGWLLLAFPLAVPATLYVGTRAAVHGRLSGAFEHRRVHILGRTAAAVGAAVCAVVIIGAVTEIV